ncbi:hypothetical protein FHS19_006056 [Paenibacillus rhizosphaerae]|uniref:Uncharacterized protein n=1 Tax=Paenibacillus rhizosphaerae TaxID=297318 RepID=A0A839TWV7_9BACL|nr:hypothetical protein [Paenibacillus rhizosphaerae]MBB3131336.1 hypothetical protein [Paenibacillus rhizosphaerae]
MEVKKNNLGLIFAGLMLGLFIASVNNTWYMSAFLALTYNQTDG